MKIDSLNGLRGIAAMLVVISHAGWQGYFPKIQGLGILGVMLFFSLSGFLMGHLYLNKTPSLSSVARYTVKRIFRVYPAYAFVLLISGGLYAVYANYPYPVTLEQLFRHLALKGEISVFWTIPVEIKFYLLFPLLWLVVSYLDQIEKKISLLVVLYMLTLVYPFSDDKIALLPYLEYFIGGTLAGLLYLYVKNKMKMGHFFVNNIIVLVLLPSLSLCVPIVFAWVFHFSLEAGGWKTVPFFPILTSVSVLCIALSTTWVSWIFSNKVLSFLGKISFSLYLVHIPCLYLTYAVLGYTTLYGLFGGVIFSLFVAYLSYRWIELPFQKLGSKILVMRKEA